MYFPFNYQFNAARIVKNFKKCVALVEKCLDASDFQ